jgi:hypothetical protein
MTGLAMTLAIGCILLVIIFSNLITALIQRLRRTSQRQGYRAKVLLTDNEIHFFKLLQTSLPQHIVLCQVAMGALITTHPHVKGSDVFRLRAKFAQKIVDFVVLDCRSRVIALIELDDRTHDKQKDAKRDAITAEAGYVTLRYESKNKPSASKILKDILAVTLRT